MKRSALPLVWGRRIGVDGRLSWREWQAQDGSKRQGVEVIANDVFFLDSRGEGGEGGQQQGGGWSQPAEAPTPIGAAAGTGGGAGASAPADDDAEVPF